MPILEVIATNKQDVIALNNSNCNRIELCAGMDQDGLSPNLEDAIKCLKVAKKPIRVMLRITGDFKLHLGQMPILLDYIDTLKRYKFEFLEGFVLGFLDEDKIDMPTTQSLIAAIHPLKVTLHKAMEQIIELEKLDDLIFLKNKYENFDTILTQGGLKNIVDNRDKILILRENFNLLLGGGINFENLEEVSTYDCDIHIGSLARINKSYDCEYDLKMIDHVVEVLKG